MNNADQIYVLVQLGSQFDPEHFALCHPLAFVGPESECVADIQPGPECNGAYLPELQHALQQLCDRQGLAWQVGRPSPGPVIAIVGPQVAIDAEPAMALLRAYIQFLQSKEVTHEANTKKA